MLGKKSRDRLSLKPFESPKLASVTKLQELPEIPLETENPKEQAEQTRHHRRIRVLPTRHCKGSVGFLLTEERRRLKPEWETKQHLIGEIMRGLSQQERSAAKKDMEEVQEVILVAHLGDTPKLDEREISLLSQAPMGYLILEATMLNKEDFQENPNGTEGVINDGGEEADTHSTLDESVESFRKINPKHLLLNHFSPRYGTKEILQALSKSLTPEERKSNRIHALIGGDLKNLSLEPKPPKINNFNTDISY
jgi:ribonuclease BN (tRNA processing enzyme)